MNLGLLKKISLIIFLILFVNIIWGYEIYILYQKTNDILQKEIDPIFIKTISLDRDKRIKEANLFYSYTYQPNSETEYLKIEQEDKITCINNTDSLKSISIESKQNNVLHSILLRKNPIDVRVLDSLFQQELKKEHIISKTLIQYTDKINNRIYRNDNDTILINYTFATKLITLGIQKEITLQAFVKVSPLCIFHKLKGHFCILSLVWFITLLVLFIIIRYIWKDLSKSFSLPDEYDLENLLDDRLVMQVSNDEIRIAPNLYFDSKRSVIIYDIIEVKLQEQSAQLFKLFLESPEYYMSYEEIVAARWGKLADSSSRLTQAIKRLRKLLAPIPVLTIKNVRNRGYQLIIKNDSYLEIDEGNL